MQYPWPIPYPDAVLQQADGEVVRDAATVEVGQRLSARVATGTLHLVTEGAP